MLVTPTFYILHDIYKLFEVFGISADMSLSDKSVTFRVATAQGKQGIWFLLFPDRENTGNFVVTQGNFLRHRENIFDCIYSCKKHVSLYIFSKFFSLASLTIISHFKLFLYELFLPIYLLYQYIYCTNL